MWVLGGQTPTQYPGMSPKEFDADNDDRGRAIDGLRVASDSIM